MSKFVEMMVNAGMSRTMAEYLPEVQDEKLYLFNPKVVEIIVGEYNKGARQRSSTFINCTHSPDVVVNAVLGKNPGECISRGAALQAQRLSQGEMNMRSKINKALKDGKEVHINCGNSIRRFVPRKGMPATIVEDIVECAMRAPWCGYDSEDGGPANWQDRIMIEV